MKKKKSYDEKVTRGENIEFKYFKMPHSRNTHINTHLNRTLLINYS